MGLKRIFRTTMPRPQIRKSVSPKVTEALKWSRYFYVFFVCAVVFLIFGRSIIPKPLFAVLLLVAFTAFVVMWLWAAYVIPPAALETARELNYHPDANVRALQKGEITIEEYVRRKENGISSATDLQASNPAASAFGPSDRLLSK
jgi:uncharacterized membrane protein